MGYPLFITRDAETRTILDMIQAGASDRHNYKMVYGIARSCARELVYSREAVTLSICDSSRPDATEVITCTYSA